MASFGTATHMFNVMYDGHTYSISGELCQKIGFLEGMIYAGLFDDLALPLPAQQSVVDMGHNLLRYMTSNPGYGMHYLTRCILGGLSSKEYVARLAIESPKNQKIELEQIREVLAQVFALIALADYWDCKFIIDACTEFITLHLSIADPISVKEWFSGIV